MSGRLRLCPVEAAALQALPLDAFVLFVAEDERPLWGLGGLLDWQMCAGLSKRLHAGDLTGTAGETVLTTASHGLAAPRIFAFGLGPQAKVDKPSFDRRALAACQSLLKAGARRVAIGLPEVPSLPEAARSLQAAVEATPGLEAWLVGPVDALAMVLPEARAAAT